MSEVINEEPVRCSYCYNSDPASLLQCKICNKWFCNSTELGQGSHIYLHLSLSKHRCVKTTPQSRFHGANLKCSKCKSNNVFDLRYDSRRRGGVPVLMCISNCLSADLISSSAFDDSYWKPVVHDRRFVHDIIPVSQVSQRCPVRLTFDLIREFESLKLTHPNLPIQKVTLKPHKPLEQVKDDYESTLEYYNVFEPLLRIEEYEQRQAVQMDGDKHTRVQFFVEEGGRSRSVIAKFTIHASEYSRDLKQWDELVLSWSFIQSELDDEEDKPDYQKRLARLESRRKKARQADESDSKVLFLDDDNELDDSYNIATPYVYGENERVEYKGQILSLRVLDDSIGSYACKLKLLSKQIPRGYHAYQSGFYDVRLREISSVLDRRIRAMQRLDDERATHQVIFDILMGNRKAMNHHDFYIPREERETMNLDAPNLRPLNDSQRQAVIETLTSRMTLIQGPPGTGKTNTAATIVYQLVTRTHKNIPDIPKENKYDYGVSSRAYLYKKPGPVLVTVPSNVAADEICKRIHRTGVNVVRLMAVSKQDQPSPVEELCVHVQAMKLMEEMFPRQMDVARRRKRGDSIDQETWKSYRNDMLMCERRVITNADVVVSTCDTSGSFVLEEVFFNTVLIDEASQATEPEVLVPITHGAQRVILVGDQCQLQPVVLSGQCKRCGLDCSLFERLIRIGMKTSLLRIQYRMHPILSAFSSHLFYNDKLKDGVKERNRPINPRICYPNRDAPLCFYHVVGNETVGGNGSSYMNMTEGKAVIELTLSLINSGVEPSQIGIITGYTGQKLLIQNLLSKSHLTSVEFASVNMYQGREKDYIIFSCVRSNNRNVIGFLSDKKRLNVALTRARYGIFVVGNAELLKHDDIWGMYVDYHIGYHSLVEGTVGSWRRLDIV